MLYRNVKTGAEFESNSEITAPNWEKMGAVSLVEEPKAKAPEVILEGTPKETKEPESEAKKTQPKKTAPKKNTKRVKK